MQRKLVYMFGRFTFALRFLAIASANSSGDSTKLDALALTALDNKVVFLLSVTILCGGATSTAASIVLGGASLGTIMLLNA